MDSKRKEAEAVIVNGKKFWPSWESARLNKTYENNCWVLRWVKSPGNYVTRYC